jgi:hypothetical protein
MQPGEDALGAYVAVHQGHLFVTTIVIHVADGAEFPVHRGQWCIHDPFHTRALRALWRPLAEYADFFCHDLIPKQRRKAVKK